MRIPWCVHGIVYDLPVLTNSQPDLIEEPLVVFVVATTGSGVEPRAMTAFWNMLLRSDLPPDLFDGLPIAVFGLGDSAYEKFCWAAKMLSRRMTSLGAIEICEKGEADEQNHMGCVRFVTRCARAHCPQNRRNTTTLD